MKKILLTVVLTMLGLGVVMLSINGLAQHTTNIKHDKILIEYELLFRKALLINEVEYFNIDEFAECVKQFVRDRGINASFRLYAGDWVEMGLSEMPDLYIDPALAPTRDKEPLLAIPYDTAQIENPEYKKVQDWRCQNYVVNEGELRDEGILRQADDATVGRYLLDISYGTKYWPLLMDRVMSGDYDPILLQTYMHDEFITIMEHFFVDFPREDLFPDCLQQWELDNSTPNQWLWHCLQYAQQKQTLIIDQLQAAKLNEKK